MRVLLLFLLVSTCAARDCVQGAIYLLATRNGGTHVTWEDVLKKVPPTAADGSDLELIPKVYDLVNPGKKLEVIYTFADLIETQDDAFAKTVAEVSARVLKVIPLAPKEHQALRDSHEYLWVGNLQEGAHCAIVWFTLREDGYFSATIVNHQLDKDGKPYTVTVGAKEFFTRTYFIFDERRP